uniref:Uncharacterized protein n=1 Tax=Vespula pensylvanica TaxID=30213 RepID=A0A834NLT0_VESPE|nr:hypothetical protein H0235_012609 [Vespula pensylvanica]
MGSTAKTVNSFTVSGLKNLLRKRELTMMEIVSKGDRNGSNECVDDQKELIRREKELSEYKLAFARQEIEFLRRWQELIVIRIRRQANEAINATQINLQIIADLLNRSDENNEVYET